MSDVLYIINPAGHGGAGMKAWEAFKASWGKPIDASQVVFTERAGHAEEIAAAAPQHDIIAAVGGDGTVGEVISGIMKRAGEKPKLAIIPCGTGNDIARAAGLLSVDDAAAALHNETPRAFDLVRVEGTAGHRYAFLFGNAGFSCIPMMRPWMKRLLGATGAYYLAVLRQVFAYRAPQMNVRVDDQEYAGETFLVVAGNAEWVSGGSMRLSPGAIPDDGELNVSIIPSFPTTKILTRLFSSIANGTHINEPGVKYITGKKVEVQSEPPAVVDLDGELFGTTPVTFSVAPHAIQIMSR